MLRGVAIDLMPSCTVPTCSKIVVMLPATHPDIDTNCHILRLRPSDALFAHGFE